MNCGFLSKAALLAVTAFTLTACGGQNETIEHKMSEISAVSVEAEDTTESGTEAFTDPADEVFRLDISIKEGQDFPQKYVIEGFNAIMQQPELPTGCEVTALCEDLCYLGFDIDKVTLADEFLPMDITGAYSMNTAYIGDPKADWGFGCYAPVIVQTADDYFESVKSPCYAVNLTGRSLKELFYQVSQGRPVIVWSTIDLIISYPTYWWPTEDGGDMVFNDFQHCVVVYGYDYEENVVHVADPLAGNVKYDMELFSSAYEIMGKQAVIICGDANTKGKLVPLEDKPNSPVLSRNKAERKQAEEEEAQRKAEEEARKKAEEEKKKAAEAKPEPVTEPAPPEPEEAAEEAPDEEPETDPEEAEEAPPEADEEGNE